MTNELNQVNISRKISSCTDYLFKTYQVICYLCIYNAPIILEHVRLDPFASFQDITFPSAELYKVLENGGQEQQIPHPKKLH